MAGNELPGYCFIFLGKKKDFCKMFMSGEQRRCYTSRTFMVDGIHSTFLLKVSFTHTQGLNHQPSDWQMTCAHLSLCVLQVLFAFSFQELVRTNTACLLTDTWWHRPWRQAGWTELLMIEFLSETSPTCLLLLICISLYWTSSCVPAGPAKHTKLKLNLNW